MDDASVHGDVRKPPALVGIYAALAAIVLVAHFGVLFEGVRHDDHLHRATLRTTGWRWNDLIESTTFEFPGRQMHLWWQTQPVQWRYPRPVTMAILKAELIVARGDPLVMHAFSLGWHWLNCVLVLHLAAWCLASRAWALLVATVFALCPNGAMAVGWTAAHNVLISNALLLAAMLMYVRSGFGHQGPLATIHVAPLCGAVSLWGAAMLARESAIVFPVLAMLLDACFAGLAALRRRWPVYALLVALALAYVIWRFFVFARSGMPAGYMSVPSNAEYVWWAVNKWIQAAAILLTHLPLYTPLDYVERWSPPLIALQVALAGLAAVVIAVYVRVTHDARGRWFGPMWMLVALASVVPIQLMPHFAYLPFVGYALAVGLFLRRLRPCWQKGMLIATVLFLATMFAFQRIVDRAQIRAEQLVIADVLQTQPPREEGSTLFFINLPLPASFTVFGLREAWERDDLTGYALTLADSTHRMSRASHIQRVGGRTLELACEPPGWFSEPIDRWFLKVTGRRLPFKAGQTVSGELFDTTVIEADERGVTRVRFTFKDTLDRDDWLFFIATPDRPMQRVRFTATGVELDGARATAAFQDRHAREIAERDLPLNLRRWALSWFGVADAPPSAGDK